MTFDISFDVGGTFTDIVVSRDGIIQQKFLKVPTTPENPAVGVLQGLAAVISEHDIAPGEVESILHATTVATNAILERRGSRTALITTKGFRDVLAIGRQKRHETYSVRLRKPEPIVPRFRVFEVLERVAADGSVVQAIDESDVEAIAAQMIADGVETAAICLLHAYANPAHEHQVAGVLERVAPGIRLSLSSSVSPKIREYERTSTTTANAFVQKIVATYLRDLEGALRELGIQAKLQVMQSSGGLVTTDFASDFPIRIVESGPAAGVLMSAAVGQQEGVLDLLTFDMGGTTAKVGAVDGGLAAVSATFEVDMVDFKRGSGLPLNIPSVELVEIGAGGGSIAQVEMGVIKVGPRSAGSSPGPACYGRGGGKPTVTDANVVLGYIGGSRFNGKAMTIDVAAAQRVIEEHIAAPLNLSVEKAAWGIHALATGNMERALRIVSIERGRDPRKYTLVAFGGAGPLHAARLARQLSIPRLILPIGAGVGSAVGLLNASPKFDLSLTRVIAADPGSLPAIRQVYSELENGLASQLRRVGIAHEEGRFSRFVYMRFRGQGFEVKVDLPEGEVDAAFIDVIRQRFVETYHRIYGRAQPDTAPLITDWYLVFEGSATARGVGSRPLEKVPVSKRQVYFPEAAGFIECPVHDRYSLSLSDEIEGPAIIEEDETSLVLLHGDRARVTAQGNIIVDIRTVSE